jgi:hypothetical protein
MALRERLVGLALICAGLASMAVVFLFWQNRQNFVVKPPVPPPGLPPNMMPLASPLDCLMPFAALAATGLVIEGFRRLVFPENYGPDD